MGDEPLLMKPASSEQAVFAEALKRVTPEARASYIDGACGTDTPLRRRVERLLRAADRAGDFLEQPPAGLTAGDDAASLENLPSEKPGDRIGRYRLLEEIGEGGCGVVYMAEQEEPVRRRVALKVIKLGMDTRSVVARFEAERQALAMMDHSNIAKVLDGGATHSGRPFFVMELVRGLRITEFCNEARLATEARLRLFVQVCHAIQHAHQKGIIHRDLKPSNILVTVNDGAPVPKVIDFGIAKATGQRLTDKTVFTQFNSFIGTPAYTSPEQAEMSSVDVDTRSDIYSLGVLLYELLTGRTPFDGEELLRSGLDEMRRVIREELPPRPSARLTTIIADGARRQASNGAIGNSTSKPDVAARGPSQDRELINAVRGDLDWIVMKCLEKDRSRRYATANGLALDIQRHLNREPVTARPPSRMYLLQKLAQRNKGALLAATIVFTALFVAVMAMAISYVRISQERNQKDAALEAARSSEKRGREQLFVSLQSQAQARRNSRQMGQRVESLAALTQAAGIRPTAELRDSAIAAMAIPDVQTGASWPVKRSELKAFAYDSLNQRYACMGQDGVISIRTIPEARELQRLEPSSDSNSIPWRPAMSFSPDGHLLAGLDSNGRLYVWRWESGKSGLRRAPGGYTVLAFSPDSRKLAAAREDWITCFDLSRTGENQQWKSIDRVFRIEFNPDNRRLAVGYERTNQISIYDADNGNSEAELPADSNGMTVLAWHPDGNLLAAAGTDPRIQIWDVKAQRQLALLEGNVEPVTFLYFHPGGELLSSLAVEGVWRLWQTSPGRMLMRIPISGWLGFGKDGQWPWTITPSDDRAELWGIVPSQEFHTFINNYGEGEGVPREGDINPDGTLLALGAADGLRIWDVKRGREVAWLRIGETSAALFRADGKELVTCGPAGGLHRWPIAGNLKSESGLQIGPASQIPLPFEPIRITRGGDDRTMAVVGASPGEAVLLDLDTGSVCLPELTHPSACYVTVSPDGQRLATSGWHSGTLKLWDGRDGRLLREEEVGLMSRVFFTPDSHELIISRATDFTFRDMKTLEVTRQMPRDIGLYPGHVAFTSDGKLMALEMAPGQIHLKEFSTGRTVARLEDPQGDRSTWMSFTPDGTQLVVAAKYAGAIHRWDLRAIRERLKTMNLDWDWPAFPPASPDELARAKDNRPARVELIEAIPAAATKSLAARSAPAKP